MSKRQEVLDIKEKSPQDFTKMQKQVDILMGLKCNQKCFFCFQKDDSMRFKDTKPDIIHILKILIQGVQQGYKRVHIA